jgi:UDP-N-acetylmuramate--alanine ligase
MLRGVDVRVAGAETHFEVREHGRTLGRVALHVPGLHNVRNALGGVAAARALGAEWGAIREGLESYQGVERRFERVGEAAGVFVVDDYAHHPTEIAATLAAARLAHADRRVVAVFQPHLYSRTRDFAEEFGRALAAADVVLVTDVYAAREAPIEGVSGRMVADAAVRAGAVVHYVAERGEVTERAMELLEAGDLCLTLGAGDLNVAAREIVTRLAARAAA